MKKAHDVNDQCEIRLRLALLDEKEGHLEEALRGYQQGTQSDKPPLAAAAMYGKGRVLAKLGDREGARAAYESRLQFPVTETQREKILGKLAELDGGQLSKETASDLDAEEAM